MRFGIIADTHGHLPAQVFSLFGSVDYIFHAGDIGSPDIIRELETICPVYAVHGNIDSGPARSLYPDILVKRIHSKTIYLIHDIISIHHLTYSLFTKNISPHIIIHGHTHKPGYQIFKHILFINPGSSSRPKGKDGSSVALLDFNRRPLLPEIITIDS